MTCLISLETVSHPRVRLFKPYNSNLAVPQSVSSRDLYKMTHSLNYVDAKKKSTDHNTSLFIKKTY
jgi:hypothetical protein